MQDEVRRRAREYPSPLDPARCRRKRVYLVDDGLATGYTVIAAAKMARSYEPAQLTLLVPVSPADSIERVEPHFDQVYCLICQVSPPSRRSYH